MTRNKRALAYPIAFSIMVDALAGRLVDVLRVLGSTQTYRASRADVTRELILKGMAVEALEQALLFVNGRPTDLCGTLMADVQDIMGKEFRDGLPGLGRDTVLHAVLSHTWPDVVQAVDVIDSRTPDGREALRKILAGPPRTRRGRPRTGREIRAQALAELVAQNIEAPEMTPPRTTQEARERARLESAADRVAMENGVSAASLLADTPGGRAAGLQPPDESAAAQGYTEDEEKPGRPHSRMGASEARQPSLGAQLKAARGETP